MDKTDKATWIQVVCSPTKRKFEVAEGGNFRLIKAGDATVASKKGQSSETMPTVDSPVIPKGVRDNVVFPLQPGDGPKRQLRRVGTKIGRKVLPFQRPIVRLGRLHLYRDVDGGLSIQWLPRRNRA